MAYKAIGYYSSGHGKCSICGNAVDFQIPEGFSLREAWCPICNGKKRSRDLARVIAKTFLANTSHSLAETICCIKGLSVYEAESSGPVHNYLCKLPRYICSEYIENVPPGSTNKAGIRCENLENLSFAAESFDLVITQDVLEHVSSPEKAFLEIDRVLKPGGYHIFTVPIHEGRSTIRRVRDENGKKIFIYPPVYHGDPLREAGSLVYTDFGGDILDHLKSLGIPAEIAVYEKFYPADVIPWITEEDSFVKYADYRESGEMLKFFLYNSIVFRSVKTRKR